MKNDGKRPEHYLAGGKETMDHLRTKLTPEEFRGYCRGNEELCRLFARRAANGRALHLDEAKLWRQMAKSEETQPTGRVMTPEAHGRARANTKRQR